ncbi:NEQ204 [Nanoarchaeum equitans Kin4-M]|uniref:Large ribosomal subunit protein uL22 n=1 Tax=Nanoarchaeum equitans (strain Kin4-M) TaxID=228908 RepID=RL22_NANEQ|nr:RecName: Full=Large ribosomal subunit protein uL22; AltName: Full=50S ribosomal protein L22 [Nanoarchaeum equitans Kin4-M]AAR39056.1 NEQ204 [Nanoarchaeum equitans Kin4-M]
MRYSVSLENVAKLYAHNLPISTKHAVEIAKMIRYLPLQLAKEMLQKVLDKELAVPFFRYNRDIPHRKKGQIHPYFKIKHGRFPENATKWILKELNSVEKNAINLGMDPNKLFIVHIAAHKGVRGYTSVYGRRARRKATHLEIMVAENKDYDPSKKYPLKELKRMGHKLFLSLKK